MAIQPIGIGSPGQPVAGSRKNLFMGFHYVKVAGRHRFSIPAQLRRILGDSKLYLVVLSAGKQESELQDVHLLRIYPESEWEKFLDTLSDEKKNNFLAASFEIKTDNLGRILLPSGASEKFNPSKETCQLVVAGCGTHIEVWQKKDWKVPSL